MATTTRTRKPLAPVTVEVRWTRPLFVNALDPKSGCLELNGEFYGVISLEPGFQFVKRDGTTYEVELDAPYPSCSCPDHTFRPNRPGGCKHIRGLQAALAELNPVA